jgi:hypothetical protein
MDNENKYLGVSLPELSHVNVAGQLRGRGDLVARKKRRLERAKEDTISRYPLYGLLSVKPS